MTVKRSPTAGPAVALHALAASCLAVSLSAQAEPRMTPVQLAQATTAPAAAPTPAGQRLTLAQAYRLALDNDAQLAAVRAATEARRERLPQARAQLLPNVSANATRFRNDLESTQPNAFGRATTTQQEYFSSSRSLTVKQPLFRPYEIADYRQAKANVADANAQLDQEVQNLAVRVTTSYLQALLAQEQLSLVMAQKTAYTTQLNAARRALAAGSGTRTDIDDAQARLDMSVAQELEARQNVGFTRRQLQTLVNVPFGELAPLDERRLPLVPPSFALPEWVARAEQSSPEMRSLQAQQEAARHEVSKARAGHLPTLDAVAQWSVSDSDNPSRVNSKYDNKSIGLQLNVPIYQGGYHNSRTRQALAELERAQEQLEATRRDLSLRVEKEYRGISEGVLRVRALEQAVQSATTLVESSRRSFQGGSRTLIDILNAEGQKVSAQRDLAEARFQYLIARIKLLSLAGQADEATVDEASGWLKP
jgi:protease secretion system outer membrane protein